MQVFFHCYHTCTKTKVIWMMHKPVKRVYNHHYKCDNSFFPVSCVFGSLGCGMCSCKLTGSQFKARFHRSCDSWGSQLYQEVSILWLSSGFVREKLTSAVIVGLFHHCDFKSWLGLIRNIYNGGHGYICCEFLQGFVYGVKGLLFQRMKVPLVCLDTWY